MEIKIINPTTVPNDFIKKMGLYMKVGVKEYWIISPKNSTVHVFTLKEDRLYSEPTIYSKEDVVKSSIFEDLEIKLNDIF